MRHRKRVVKLGRTASHRRALMSNLASSLISYKKIKTTAAKAKALRSFIERLITKARRGDLHSRRTVLKHIHQRDIVQELFDEVAPKFADRPGGYTRVTKIGRRRSDSSEMALIELVGFEGVYKERKEESEKERQKRKENKDKEAKEMDEAADAQTAEAGAEVKEEK